MFKKILLYFVVGITLLYLGFVFYTEKSLSDEIKSDDVYRTIYTFPRLDNAWNENSTRDSIRSIIDNDIKEIKSIKYVDKVNSEYPTDDIGISGYTILVKKRKNLEYVKSKLEEKSFKDVSIAADIKDGVRKMRTPLYLYLAVLIVIYFIFIIIYFEPLKKER